MKQKVHYIWSFIVLLVFNQCVEPIDPESIGFDDLLVVEALITDEPGNQVITLTRTSQITADSIKRFETNAVVYITDNEGRQVNFDEEGPGQYVTSFPFSVVPGEQWQLFIETEDHGSYQSDEVEVLETPHIDSVYAVFDPEPSSINQFGGRFNFFLDANDLGETKYMRWTWNRTFELSVATPSRWLWTGGNTFLIREPGSVNDHLQVQNCWSTKQSTQVISRSLVVPGIGINALALNSFHSDDRKMLRRYSLEVRQYAQSEASYNYWNEIAKATQEQDGLSAIQVGTITGNIRSMDDPEEVVLGIFEVVDEEKVRRNYVPLDFTEAGYRRRFNHFIECYDIEPVVSDVNKIGETMEELGPGFAIAFFTTSPPAAYYLPIRCSECTVYGSNQKPEFWD